MKVSSRWSILTMEEPGEMSGNFALNFSLIFLNIFVHISGFIRLITLIWTSLERSFPPAEVELDDTNFGRQKWKNGHSSSRPVTPSMGSQWVNELLT